MVENVEVVGQLLGPIHQQHQALGAQFAEFGGWNMPVAYAGTVGEHQAVRTTVGIFDVSHLGKALVTGKGAAEFVNRCLTNDFNKIQPGKAQYTLCTDDDGGVIDDLIAYWVSDDEVFLIPNAANNAAVVERLAAAAPAGIAVTNQHREYGVVAIQGPKSAEVLAALGLPTTMDYMAFTDAELVSEGKTYPVRVCRTGYTGEHGYELLPRWHDSSEVFALALTQVQALGGQPAGLGARDTLRTEMGYPLHGHELSIAINPLEAGIGWAVGWKKAEFFGREALLEVKAAAPARRLVGLKALGRGVLRAELSVVDNDGKVLGETTSGTFSPTLKQGIALALLDSAKLEEMALTVGDTVNVDVRGRLVACEIATLPFVAATT